VEINGHNRVLL